MKLSSPKSKVKIFQFQIEKIQTLVDTKITGNPPTHNSQTVKELSIYELMEYVSQWNTYKIKNHQTTKPPLHVKKIVIFSLFLTFFQPFGIWGLLYFFHWKTENYLEIFQDIDGGGGAYFQSMNFESSKIIMDQITSVTHNCEVQIFPVKTV